MDRHVPSREELYQYIRNQGKLLVAVAVALALLFGALIRKGILSWGDLVRLEAADG